MLWEVQADEMRQSKVLRANHSLGGPRNDNSLPALRPAGAGWPGSGVAEAGAAGGGKQQTAKELEAKRCRNHP